MRNHVQAADEAESQAIPHHDSKGSKGAIVSDSIATSSQDTKAEATASDTSDSTAVGDARASIASSSKKGGANTAAKSAKNSKKGKSDKKSSPSGTREYLCCFGLSMTFL